MRNLVSKRFMSALAQMREIVDKQLTGIKEAGTWKTERVIITPQANRIKVKGNFGELLNFCANNYLGLSVSANILFTPQGLVKHRTSTHCRSMLRSLLNTSDGALLRK